MTPSAACCAAVQSEMKPRDRASARFYLALPPRPNFFPSLVFVVAGRSFVRFGALACSAYVDGQVRTGGRKSRYNKTSALEQEAVCYRSSASSTAPNPRNGLLLPRSIMRATHRQFTRHRTVQSLWYGVAKPLP